MSDPIDPSKVKDFEDLKKITMTVLKQLEILQAEKDKMASVQQQVESEESIPSSDTSESTDEIEETVLLASPSTSVTIKSELMDEEAAVLVPDPVNVAQPPKLPANLKLQKSKGARTKLNQLKQSTSSTLARLEYLKAKCDDLKDLGITGSFYPKDVEQLKRQQPADRTMTNGYDSSSTKSDSKHESSSTNEQCEESDNSSDDSSTSVSTERPNSVQPRPAPVHERFPEVPLASGNSDVCSVTDGQRNRNRRGARGGRPPRKRNTDNNLGKQSRLVLQLLGLSYDEREMFLLLQAHKFHLVTLNETTMQNSIKPMFLPVFNHLKMEAKLEIQQHISSALRTAPQPQQAQQVPMKPPPKKVERNYEALVSRLLAKTVLGLKNADTVDLNVLDQKMVLKNVSNRTTNGYLQPESIAELEQFVKFLVSLDFGYVIEGEIRVNAKNAMEAYVSDPTGTRDVFINSIFLRRCALHGDIVRVFVLSHNNEQASESSDPIDPTGDDTHRRVGFVIEILKKVHSRQCIGTMLPSQGRKPRLQPRDGKVPIIEVVFKTVAEKQQLTLDNQNTLLLIEINDWVDEKPLGEIVEIIGKVDDLVAEMQAILMENNLDVAEYAKDILDTVPTSQTYKIPPEEYECRKDLRDQCVFTIDPLTAKDLDDALSCRRLENGNYEIGVHISDVTHFLKEDTPLDDIVKEKATSIYMANRVFHMLPRELCMLCSLLPGEDKLAFSVFFEMTDEGEVVSTSFTKSVLNSCTQMAYEHAQAMIENPEKVFDEEELPPIFHNYTPAQLSQTVNTLFRLSMKLREKRVANGALRIDQPKLAFQLNPENGLPESYCVYPIRESNRMIEDFMLLANQTVADHIYKKFPDISLLRLHYPPSSTAITKLKQFFEKHSIKFEIETSKHVQESIARMIEEAGNVEATKTVVSALTIKPMTRARYFCSSMEVEEGGQENGIPFHFQHYALSIPIYTHFTSPIRRYADVLVHRVLAAAIGCEPAPKRDPETLQKLANRCNVQKYNAKLAGEQSSALYFAHYVQSKGSLRMKAAVMGAYSFNLEVVLIETGDVVKIYYKHLEPKVSVKVLEFDNKPNHLVLSFPQDNFLPQICRIFSEIDVEVTVIKGKLSINQIFGTA